MDKGLTLVAAALAGLSLIAQAPPSAPVAVRVYTVTDAAAFPALQGGKVLVFLNGLFQAPGIDYYPVSADGKIRFYPGFLHNGDQIEVVTLP